MTHDDDIDRAHARAEAEYQNSLIDPELEPDEFDSDEPKLEDLEALKAEFFRDFELEIMDLDEPRRARDIINDLELELGRLRARL